MKAFVGTILIVFGMWLAMATVLIMRDPVNFVPLVPIITSTGSLATLGLGLLAFWEREK